MDLSFSGHFSTSRALQIFQVMRMGAVILTSILLAKSGLDTAGIGNYEMLLYIGTTLTFFWVNGLLQGMPPVYVRLKEDDRKAFIFNNFLVFCGISASLFLLLFFGEKWMTPVLTGQPEVPHFRLFCIYLLLNLPAFPVEYYYLLNEKPRQIVVWGVVVFGLQVAAVYVPVALGFGLQGGFLALIGLSAFKLIWAAVLVMRLGKPEWRLDLILYYLKFSAPLMLNVLVGGLVLPRRNGVCRISVRLPGISAGNGLGDRARHGHGAQTDGRPECRIGGNKKQNPAADAPAVSAYHRPAVFVRTAFPQDF